MNKIFRLIALFSLFTTTLQGSLGMKTLHRIPKTLETIPNLRNHPKLPNKIVEGIRGKVFFLLTSLESAVVGNFVSQSGIRLIMGDGKVTLPSLGMVK